MHILFIHQNFSGQYRQLVPALQKQGHHLLALSQRKEKHILGVRNICYSQRNNTPDLHPWLLNVESPMVRAEGVAHYCEQLKQQGYIPDVIYVHTGWGESLFLRDVWSQARIIGFFEYYYHAQGVDSNFDPEFPIVEKNLAFKLRMRNTHLLSSLESCDMGISPTQFQHSLFPKVFRNKIHTIHDGIQTQIARPNPDAWIHLNRADCTFKVSDPLITFANRNLEPMRGYHRFMRALPEILRRNPRAHVVIIGHDSCSYGSKSKGLSWKEKYLQEVKSELDLSRVHFVGKVAYEVFIKLLQVSAVHVYLTYPFVLSWSLLEAMSIGCKIVASRTAPVQEVIEDKKQGLLVDFFSKSELVDAVSHILAQPSAFTAMGQAARQRVVQQYDFEKVCLPQQLGLIQQEKSAVSSAIISV